MEGKSVRLNQDKITQFESFMMNKQYNVSTNHLTMKVTVIHPDYPNLGIIIPFEDIIDSNFNALELVIAIKAYRLNEERYL